MCEVRGKICNDCPFSRNSIPGWLADYSIADIEEFVFNEANFPCHKMVVADELDQEETGQLIAEGKLKLCRGYVECVAKSGKFPKYNKVLRDAMTEARQDGFSEDSMNIREFRKHHSIFLKNKTT